jgi:RND superfamily putative drug exporter
VFERLGRWTYKWRIAVILAWVVAAVLSLPLLPGVTDVLKVGGFSHDGLEAARTRATLERELGFPPSALVVNFHSDTLTVDDPAFERQVREALSGLEAIPEVTGITYHTFAPSHVSRDRHTAYEVVGLSVDPERSQEVMPEIERRLKPTELEMLVGGGPAFYADVERTSQEDLRRAEILAFPIALVVLVLVFGSVVSAAVPVAVGGFSIVLVLALIALVGRVADLSIFAMNVATMLGLGLAVDYALFLTSRFREELPRRPVGEAVAVTVGRGGRAVFFSGLTVLIGLGGLMTFEFMFLRSIGIVGGIVVAVSLLAALTLLPAILGVLGNRIDSLKPPVALRGGHFWAPLARWVMAHPGRVLVPTLLVLLLLGLPFLSLRLSSPDPSILPERLESRRAFDQLKEEFSPGSLNPILLAIRSRDDITSPENLGALYALSRRLRQEPGVVGIDSIVDVDPRLTLDQYELMYRDRDDVPDLFAQAVLGATTSEHVALMQVNTAYLWNDPRSAGMVERLRATDLPGDLTMEVGGGTAEVMDVVAGMYGQFPRALLIIVVATYLALLAMLGSVLLPLKAIVMNTLSILASYGALVWVFQEGHLDWLLRFQPLGFVETSLPILMFCILFGLSMDYEVFLLSRIREEWERTGDNVQSVAAGLERSGRIITSAALLVVVVGLSFVTAEIILVKALGLGVALAVLLDATLVRALLVPATMRLLGDWNWWAPRFVRRRLAQVRFGE